MKPMNRPTLLQAIICQNYCHCPYTIAPQTAIILSVLTLKLSVIHLCVQFWIGYLSFWQHIHIRGLHWGTERHDSIELKKIACGPLPWQPSSQSQRDRLSRLWGPDRLATFRSCLSLSDWAFRTDCNTRCMALFWWRLDRHRLHAAAWTLSHRVVFCSAVKGCSRCVLYGGVSLEICHSFERK